MYRLIVLAAIVAVVTVPAFGQVSTVSRGSYDARSNTRVTEELPAQNEGVLAGKTISIRGFRYDGDTSPDDVRFALSVLASANGGVPVTEGGKLRFSGSVTVGLGRVKIESGRTNIASLLVNALGRVIGGRGYQPQQVDLGSGHRVYEYDVTIMLSVVPNLDADRVGDPVYQAGSISTTIGVSESWQWFEMSGRRFFFSGWDNSQLARYSATSPDRARRLALMAATKQLQLQKVGGGVSLSSTRRFSATVVNDAGNGVVITAKADEQFRPEIGANVRLRRADGTGIGRATVSDVDEETGLVTLKYNPKDGGNTPIPEGEMVAVFERRL